MSRFGTGVAALAVLAWHGVVHAAGDEGFRLELSPYAWLAGIDASVTARGREASFDLSFDDLLSEVNAGFMGEIAARYNSFVFYGQYDYIDLSSNGDFRSDRGLPVPPGGRIKAEIETQIATVALGYRIGDRHGHSVDLLVGLRDIDIDTTLRHEGARFEQDVESTDTIVMVRPSFRLSEHWRFVSTLAYAVSGDSDTHYELKPEIQYLFSDTFAVMFGYRRLHYDLSSGARNTASFREFDGNLSGFLVGLSWTPSRL